jgi:hypothetical protein
VLKKTVEELPYPKIGKALMTEPTDTSPAGNPYLYRHDVQSPLSSLLGVPIRNVSRDAAQRIGEAENSRSPRF